MKDIRTLGYVLRRTNYAEADRILNLITPVGKITVMAKGVRKEKSKLAGGIELFSLTDFNIHMGRGEMGIVTSAKMVKHYDKIVKDLAKMELAALILKKVSAVAEGTDSPEYFKIVDWSLAFIDAGANLGMVEAWFWLKLMKVMGEEMNLYRDARGEKLVAGKRYAWNAAEAVFDENERGEYGTDEIKMLRLMLANDLSVVSRVKVSEAILLAVLKVVRMAGKV